MKQGNIGDCYYLSSLMGLAQSPEGQELLASLIEPHYDASKTHVDGYYVTIFNDPADPTRSGTQRVLVHDYYLNGVTQNGQVTVYSLMEQPMGKLMAEVRTTQDNRITACPEAGAKRLSTR